MTKEIDSYEHWEIQFKELPLEELVLISAGGFSVWPLPKLAALRNRFLDITFHDKETQPNMRHLAACWARALESAAYLLFLNDDASLDAFLNDRKSGKDLALEYGYGSEIYLASTGSPDFAEKLFSGHPVASDEELQRREFLIQVSFGRTSDFANNA